jgi:hypothetical protein
MYRTGSLVIFISGRRMERREKAQKWSPNEMKKKSLKFQILFILRVSKMNVHSILNIFSFPSGKSSSPTRINKKPDLQKKDRASLATLHSLPPKTLA